MTMAIQSNMHENCAWPSPSRLFALTSLALARTLSDVPIGSLGFPQKSVRLGPARAVGFLEYGDLPRSSCTVGRGKCFEVWSASCFCSRRKPFQAEADVDPMARQRGRMSSNNGVECVCLVIICVYPRDEGIRQDPISVSLRKGWSKWRRPSA